MFSLVSIAAVGGLLTAAITTVQAERLQPRRRRLVTTLVDATQPLSQPNKPFPSRQRGQTAKQGLKQMLTTIDNRYQTWFQAQIDPLFSNRTRREQLATLAAGREPQVGEKEQEINRHIGIGAAAVGTVGLATLTGLPLAPLVIATGFYLTIPLYRLSWHIAVTERKLSVAHLLALYFTGMWLGGYYTIGSVGMILLGVAQKVMAICESNMQDSLVNIFGQQPQRVWVLVNDVETEIPFTALQVDDILVLNAGQMIPIDGTIIAGMAAVDQRMLTGEAQPVEKEIGDSVLAATIVLSGQIQVRVEKTGNETTAAKIGEVLNRTEAYRMATEQKAIAIAEKSLVPMLAAGAIALPLAGVSGMFAMLGSNFTMNMVALRPLTVLNFFNTASNAGILIKDAEALEQLNEITTIVFDKTGTLTLEQPHVTAIYPSDGWHANRVLTLAAAAEYRQDHPIAQAILAAAADQKLSLPRIDEAAYQVGFGLQITVDRQQVCVGSLRFMQTKGITLTPDVEQRQQYAEALGYALVYVAVDGLLAGIIELQSTIRPEAKQVITQLQEQGYTIYIISGDHEVPTQHLAQTLGIDTYFAEVLPEEKAARVQELQAAGQKVCFVGDGINDAIALRQADVSISLCGATTAATDTAQIVLMNADLRQLHTLLALGQKLRRNINVNFAVATLFSLLSGGSILFLHLKFVAVEVLAATQLLTGVGIASKSLLDRDG